MIRFSFRLWSGKLLNRSALRGGGGGQLSRSVRSMAPGPGWNHSGRQQWVRPSAEVRLRLLALERTGAVGVMSRRLIETLQEQGSTPKWIEQETACGNLILPNIAGSWWKITKQINFKRKFSYQTNQFETAMCIRPQKTLPQWKL